MGLCSGRLGIIGNPPIYIWVADGITDIMAQIAAKVSKPLNALLPGGDFSKVAQIAGKEILNVVLVHIGTHIPVIPVAEDGDIVKKDIRPLEAKLIKPAVFGDNIF